MPIYDYACRTCGHRFEAFHGLNEAGPHQCPECGGTVNRVFAPPTIVFKGSGWAKLDRRYSGAPTKKGSGGEGRAGEGRAGEGSTSGSDSSPGASSGSGSGPASGSSSASSGSGETSAAPTAGPRE
ncbi:MAG: zinc ribbon domain-containing protein [Chloroflexi bacterium]|nr:zinc ribbon domain-containing protein [Chloroflexota bacterium]